jgi:multidrug resistance efflux pump
MFQKTLFTFFLTLLCTSSWADIYKYVDESGNVTFTNTPIKGAVRIMAEPNAPRRNTEGNSTSNTTANRSPRVAAPSPVNFPRVDAATQKSRDSNRKQILADELANEQAMLANAQKALREADANRSADEKNNPKLYLERIGRLRETIVMHEKNLAALQAEISRVR